MLKIKAEFMRFLGMYAPLQSVRIAMYRKAGIRIGKVQEFGSRIWLDINFRNLINIEDNVILPEGVQILSHSLLYNYDEEGERGFFPVIIKKGARISMRAIILAGVTIGENSVIGAGAVVTKDIPPNCVAVGVPAKPIRYFNCVPSMTNKCVVRDGKTPSNRSMIYVKCKTCDVGFWSDLRCDKKIFSTLDLRGNYHRCPNGHKNRYDKKDYYYEN